MTFSISLSTKNFKEVSRIAGNNEFHFIIGNEKVSCHKFVAAFLSQSILQILLSDPTVDAFYIDLKDINSQQKQQKEAKVQSILQSLILGEEIQIQEQDLHDFISDLDKMNKNTKISELSATTISALLQLSQILKNDEINEQIYRNLFSFLIPKQKDDSSTSKESKTLTKDEIEQKINFIQKVELFLSIIENSQERENNKGFIEYATRYLEQEYGDVIDEIASHFFEISEKYLNEMNEELLGAVLSSSKLKVESEDSLLFVLLNRRKLFLSKKDDEIESNEFFIEKVEFEYLSEKAVGRFLDEVEFDEISFNVWAKIKKRLVLPVQIELTGNQRYKMMKPAFVYNISNPFNGILKHLTDISNGNIQKNSTVKITVSKLCCGSCESLVDFTREDGYTHVYGNSSPRWLQIDFKSRKIQIDSYLIKSPQNSDSSGNRKLKNWIIEVSNDCSRWEAIDERTNVSELNGDHKMQLFKIAKCSEPFRYFRIITDKDNWNDYDGFNICKLELFGNINE